MDELKKVRVIFDYILKNFTPRDWELFVEKFGQDPTTEDTCTYCDLPFDNHKRLLCIR